MTEDSSRLDSATKTCSKCMKNLPTDAFRKRSRSKDGLQARCIKCNQENSQQWYQANREALAEKARVARQDEAARLRAYRLKTRYKLTSKMYEYLLEMQGGCCAIGEERCSSPAVVDHDHRCCPRGTSCGLCVRGLLCSYCNRWLGRIEQFPEHDWPLFVSEKVLNYMNRRPLME